MDNSKLQNQTTRPGLLLSGLLHLLLLVLGMMAIAEFARAQAIVSDLSQNRVSITANFDGSQIFIFGAVKSNIMPDVNAAPLDVIIELSGPPNPVMVRKKVYKFGIWINDAAVEVSRAPSFYSLASTRPVSQIISDAEREKYRIGLDYAVDAGNGTPAEFGQAVIRIRQDEGIFTKVDGPVKLTQETLFTTEVSLPANLVEGDYTASIYLVRDQKIVAESRSAIAVRKTGLERWLFVLAHESPLIYGALSLLVALVAGWAASEAFRLIRR